MALLRTRGPRSRLRGPPSWTGTQLPGHLWREGRLFCLHSELKRLLPLMTTLLLVGGGGEHIIYGHSYSTDFLDRVSLTALTDGLLHARHHRKCVASIKDGAGGA